MRVASERSASAVHRSSVGLLRRRRVGGGDGQLLHPACACPGTPVDTMMAKYPDLSPVGAEGARGRVRRRAPGQPAAPVLGLPRRPRPRQPRHLGHLYPATVDLVLAQTIPWTLALVGTATVISFVLGTLLGILAAWRRGGWLDQAPAGLHVPAGDALLLPRAARDPAVLAALAHLPDRPGLHARAAARLELAVHRAARLTTRSCRR